VLLITFFVLLTTTDGVYCKGTAQLLINEYFPAILSRRICPWANGLEASAVRGVENLVRDLKG
jgi:hypothetical protein